VATEEKALAVTASCRRQLASFAIVWATSHCRTISQPHPPIQPDFHSLQFQPRLPIPLCRTLAACIICILRAALHWEGCHTLVDRNGECLQGVLPLPVFTWIQASDETVLGSDFGWCCRDHSNELQFTGIIIPNDRSNPLKYHGSKMQPKIGWFRF